MKQTTAKTADEVRRWIESTPHHNAYKEPAIGPTTHMNLANYHERLRIPVEIWRLCSIKVGDQFDNRMYRWDYQN